ncbi:unnamed protein product [Pylaiella littoralis]
MAVSSKGALSFKVIARVGKGEQLMVCGDAPFLGGGDPERAIPLFTTPADYPLWFSKEDLPRPAGSKTAHHYRFCVNRAGRFYRWDAVEQPRIIRPSKTPHIARDTLDKEPSEEEEEEEEEGHKEDKDRDDKDIAGMVLPHNRVISPDSPGGGARGGGGGGGGLRSEDGQQENENDRKQQQEEEVRPQRDGASRATATKLTSGSDGGGGGGGGSGSFEHRRSGEATAAAAAETNGNAAAATAAAATACACAGNATATAPAAPSGGAGVMRGGPLETPSFAAARTAATAAAFLLQGDCLGLSPVADDENANENNDSLASLQFGAEELSRRQWHQRQREDGHDVGQAMAIARLRRPPSLEAEDGEGAGLGLGLRLGVEAMSSPPPRAVMDKANACPPPWRSRDGGVIVASFFLPVTLKKRAVSVNGALVDEWTADWDHEQLIALQQQQTDLRVVRVGTLKCAREIGDDDKAAVVKALLKLHCVPIFLSESLTHQCYYSYCKGVLWPVMHGMLEMYDNIPNTLLDDSAITSGWQAYKQVNRAFRDKVVEVFHEGDKVWVHGFHLAILPAFLDRSVKVARIGLFLHTPFPPSEVFRALPHREDLLRGMLGADQIGFHRFSDNRHFMSCCRRLLGLRHLHSQETGLVQIVHGGKPTILTERHAGIDPDAVRASLRKDESTAEVARLKELHGDRIVVAGVERVEKIKGVWLKLLAFEDMLRRHPDLVGRVSMHEVGIANPARGSDYRACQDSLSELAGRMNAKHGPGTVVYEERDAKDYTLSHRAALMSVASVFVKTPVHNGLSVMPMEFRVVQEDLRAEAKAKAKAKAKGAVTPGVLILSEAVSCSPVLRGSFAVNPWQVQAVADAMTAAVTAEADDKTAWHEEDVEWCLSNTTAKWAEDVLGVLTLVAKENRSRYATTGLGLTSRVVGTDPSFKRLDTNCARRAYGLSKSRVFFLDYGGTLVKDTPTTAQAGVNGKVDYDRSQRSKAFHLRPGRAVVEGLAELCRDPRNIVFVVSGRGKDELQEAFGHIKGLGLAAEHGSFFRWPDNGSTPERESDVRRAAGGDGWEALHPGLVDNEWKDVTRRFMQDFQIHTHGSYIEEKGTAVLWHYGNAEPEFGGIQAKQLQDELTDVLRFSTATNNTYPEDIENVSSASVNININKHVNSLNAAASTTATTAITSKKMSMATTNMSRANMSMNMTTTAATGSISRSNSVASEGLGLIEITHEAGLNSEAGGGGAYLEVRARGANKGNFVHMVLDRLGWPAEGAASAGNVRGDLVAAAAPGGGRFCLCVGDDVSDEDMFIAVKSYEGAASSMGACSGPSLAGSIPPHTAGHVSTSSSGKENRTPGGSGGQQQQQQKQQQAYFLTVTVGSKPSDADAWLPGVDDVVSLLRTLGRVTSRHGAAPWSKLAPPAAAAAAVAISKAPLAETRGGHPGSPTREFRSVSASHTDAYETPQKDHITVGWAVEGGGAKDTIPRVASAALAMNVGAGMPVVRRHSYTIGGKPRISLSLGEFLRGVAQPELEPPMF